MRWRIIGFELFCVTFLLLSHRPAVGGQVDSPLQTQSTSPAGVLVATDWGPGTNGVTNPLVFDQFNPALGTLNAIDITLQTTIRNDFELVFVKTPIPTTIYVATSQTSDPSILSNAAARASLTDGPTITLFGPDGTTQIFGAPATRQPVDFVQRTETSGTWSSLLAASNPNFIAPTMTQQSFSLALTAANTPSLFSDFIGMGQVDLPVSATAFSSFFSSSGNGGGAVLTKADAVVTVQYSYNQAQTVTPPPPPPPPPPSTPEPSSAILLAVGFGVSIVACRWRRRAANISQRMRH
jgi:hypothetical protein